MIELHPRLAADTREIGRFELCRILLMNDANYPWFILLPDRPDLGEIYQLSDADQGQLMRESSRLAAALARAFQADKINIAALGNQVPQLHVHHIVRYRTDAAWPAPVWGRVAPIPYSAGEMNRVIRTLSAALDQYLPRIFET